MSNLFVRPLKTPYSFNFECLFHGESKFGDLNYKDTRQDVVCPKIDLTLIFLEYIGLVS